MRVVGVLQDRLHHRFFQQRFGCQRLLLACTQIGLKHPLDGRMLTIEAPLEDSFARVIGALGWSTAILPSFPVADL